MAVPRIANERCSSGDIADREATAERAVEPRLAREVSQDPTRAHGVFRRRRWGRNLGACPTFFRAAVEEAKRGGDGYASAGYSLAIHLRDLLPCDAEEEAEAPLDAALEDGDPAIAIMRWVEKYAPRCYSLVPALRDSFLRGIDRALEDGRVE